MRHDLEAEVIPGAMGLTYITTTFRAFTPLFFGRLAYFNLFLLFLFHDNEGESGRHAPANIRAEGVNHALATTPS